MRNTWVLGTIVGQAIVTLVSIGYGMSAHSSWEAERQRRIDSERAAVAEMATAMKGAGDRLVSVEQELKRCQLNARRRAQPAPAAPTTSAPAPAPGGSPLVLSTHEAFTLVAGPISWLPARSAGARERP